MRDRERLIKLINKGRDGYPTRPIINGVSQDLAEFLADHLLANGVTLQEWISVEDRLPEEEERVLIYTKTNITNYGTYTKRYGAYRKEGFICQDGFMWLNTASHWMPLPQPPKGE